MIDGWFGSMTIFGLLALPEVPVEETIEPLEIDGGSVAMSVRGSSESSERRRSVALRTDRRRSPAAFIIRLSALTLADSELMDSLRFYISLRFMVPGEHTRSGRRVKIRGRGNPGGRESMQPGVTLV